MEEREERVSERRRDTEERGMKKNMDYQKMIDGKREGEIDDKEKGERVRDIQKRREKTDSQPVRIGTWGVGTARADFAALVGLPLCSSLMWI